MLKRAHVMGLCLLLLCLWQTPGWAACMKVGPDDDIKVNTGALKSLGQIGISRDGIFAALKETATPETSGCWAGATGNFDAQIVSVGTLQWNYGQKSLQPLMRRFRTGARGEFQSTINKLMPVYGKLVFSEGCLRSTITADCKSAILQIQTNASQWQTLRQEFNSLFESPEMRQIQTDRFVALLQSVQDDLKRLFPKDRVTPRQIKWAIDTKVQQGDFPGDRDIARVRERWQTLDSKRRHEALRALIAWYNALATSVDQGGTRLDGESNVRIWTKKIDNDSVNDEQADLLNLTFLNSRTAQGQGGHWQALTFQRRAKIILSAGCVGGDCVGLN